MFLRPGPIIAQFLLMKFGPVENQPKGPARQLSLNDFHRFDPDFGFMLAVCRVLAVYCVEGRRVIDLIHPDDDSEEDTECRHERVWPGLNLGHPATGGRPEVGLP